MDLSNLRNSVGSGVIVTAITTMQAVVLAPLLIKSVGMEVYGAWIIVADVLVLLQVFDFGLTAYGAQKIASARVKGDVGGCGAHFFATTFVISGLVAILSLSAYMWLYDNRNIFGLDEQNEGVLRECIIIGVISVGTQLLSYSFVAPSRALEKLNIINAFSVLGAIAGFALMIVLLFLGFGLYAAASGLLARSVFNLIGGVLSVYSLRSMLGLHRVAPIAWRAALVDQLRNAPATFVGNVAVLAIYACENILIGKAAGFEAVAIYSVSRKIFDLVRSVVDIFSYSAYGGIAAGMAKLSGGEKGLYLHNFTMFVVLLTFSLVVPAYAWSEIFVTLWVGKENFAGPLVVSMIAVALFASCLSSYIFNGLRAQGRFNIASLNIAGELLMKVLFAVALIPEVGSVGMPIASIVASMVIIFVGLHLTGMREFLTVSVEWFAGLKLMAISAVCAYVSYFEMNIVMALTLKLVCMGLSLLALKKGLEQLNK